jgi:hypothetical protein
VALEFPLGTTAVGAFERLSVWLNVKVGLRLRLLTLEIESSPPRGYASDMQMMLQVRTSGSSETKFLFEERRCKAPIMVDF